MALGVGVERRNAHQTVHARFGLQPAIGVLALDLQSNRLDARLFARRFFLDRHRHAVRCGPTRIHAQQDPRPIVGLGSASAGIDFEIGVVAVGFTGQQGLELGAAGIGLDAFQQLARFVDQAFVAFEIAELGKFDGVLKILFERFYRIDRSSQLIALAHQGLGRLRLVPQGRILGAGIEFIEMS